MSAAETLLLAKDLADSPTQHITAIGAEADSSLRSE